MSWIIFTFVAAFILFGVPALARRFLADFGAPGAISRHVVLWGRVALGLIWGVATAFNSFQEVPSGHVGVVKNFGAISGQIDAGVSLVPPWSTVQKVSTQVDKLHYDQIDAFSKETQNVYITASLNASVSRVAVQRLMTQVGPDFQRKLIDSRVANFVKEESVKFTATQIAPNRERIRIAVRDQLRRDLRPYSIDIIDFLIDNISFDTDFENSIIAKQVATQQAQQEQANVARKRALADQAIEEARGQAEAIKTRASAQAEANAKIAASLTDALIQQNAVDKLNPNIKVIVVPSGSININNLGDLAKEVANSAGGG
jgi:prohibitin 2